MAARRGGPVGGPVGDPVGGPVADSAGMAGAASRCSKTSPLVILPPGPVPVMAATSTGRFVLFSWMRRRTEGGKWVES